MQSKRHIKKLHTISQQVADAITQLFFLRARSYLLLATLFLAQEEDHLNIPWLLF